MIYLTRFQRSFNDEESQLLKSNCNTMNFISNIFNYIQLFCIHTVNLTVSEILNNRNEIIYLKMLNLKYYCRRENIVFVEDKNFFQ